MHYILIDDFRPFLRTAQTANCISRIFKWYHSFKYYILKYASEAAMRLLEGSYDNFIVIYYPSVMEEMFVNCAFIPTLNSSNTSDHTKNGTQNTIYQRICLGTVCRKATGGLN